MGPFCCTGPIFRQWRGLLSRFLQGRTDCAAPAAEHCGRTRQARRGLLSTERTPRGPRASCRSAHAAAAAPTRLPTVAARAPQMAAACVGCRCCVPRRPQTHSVAAACVGPPHALALRKATSGPRGRRRKCASGRGPRDPPGLPRVDQWGAGVCAFACCADSESQPSYLGVMLACCGVAVPRQLLPLWKRLISGLHAHTAVAAISAAPVDPPGFFTPIIILDSYNTTIHAWPTSTISFKP